MKKTFKYILITSIMMFVGMNSSKAGIAHDCKYSAGNNYVHLQTMDDGGDASAYRISSGVNNTETVKMPDSDNTYGGKKCPTYVLYEWDGLNSNLYGKSTSDAKDSLEALAKHDGFGDKYFIAPLVKIDSIPVELLNKEETNDYSNLQTCEYGNYKVYVDKSNSKAYVTSDSPSFHIGLPEPYVDYSWFKEGCPYKLYTSGGPDNYIFSNESFINATIISLTSDSKENSNSNTGDPSNNKETFNCESISETSRLVKSIYNTIKYLIPVLIIGLSIVDFIKVVASGDDKEYKNAWNKLIKRIIVGIVILLLPVILSMIIKMSGIAGAYNIAENDLFCILV